MHYTYWMLGRYEQALLTDLEDIQVLRHMSLWMLGRQAEALEGVTRLEEQLPTGGEWLFLTALRAAMQGKREECIQASRDILASGFHDPEGLYLVTGSSPSPAPGRKRSGCSSGLSPVGSTAPRCCYKTPGSTAFGVTRPSSGFSIAQRVRAPPRRPRSGRRVGNGC